MPININMTKCPTDTLVAVAHCSNYNVIYTFHIVIYFSNQFALLNKDCSC